MKLVSVQDAQKLILDSFQKLDLENIPLMDAYGRILGEDVQSPTQLPRFDYSSMDGFAIRSKEFSSERVSLDLDVIGDIPAGSQPVFSIFPGQAARIMTGAPLPEGADCVVPVEDTNFSSQIDMPSLPDKVQINRRFNSGDNVRRRGSEIEAKELLLSAGRILQPQDLGLFAALGMENVPVVRKPKVVLFSSGNEIVTPGSILKPGQIYDSNSFSLSSLIAANGGIPLSLGIVLDQEAHVKNMFDNIVNMGSDLILTSAGVSVGAYDYVRKIIELDGKVSLWRINMRPGKPLLFGHYAGIPVIGLPGNPVSAILGFMMLVIPALNKMLGQKNLFPTRQITTLAEDVTSDGRESYLRAIVTKDADHKAHPLPHQSSGNLFSLVKANALLIIPAGVKSLPAGSEVEVIPLFNYPY